ncbi:MAG TPA: glycosyltransferase [Solirubrobacteraceae bacterium]|jgi:glycosyltransferase involved in cell wall biosynthesis|nr:glycosyltransferase [Solirubrobacteraceae bacterium]
MSTTQRTSWTGEATEEVTLVHDYLLVMRGAERTFAAMADLYGRAPIVTLLYDEEGTDKRFAGRSITTSPLQRLGVRQSGFRRLLPLYPSAVDRLELPACEVVLSSSSAFAHGVHAPEGAVHLCYCYTPFRYAWYEQARALEETPWPLRGAMRSVLSRIRRWDLAASRSVDAYIAISELSRERIRRYYHRDATIIHPPVETQRFAPGEPGDALLVVSEIVRHKRLHIALEAARRAGAPIRVAGTGPDLSALKEAYPEVEFLGRVGDRELAELYAQARAVIVPSMEEFGITAVEAQAAGRPVIAAAAGGALETVIDGVTGKLVPIDDVEGFSEAIAGIDAIGADPAAAVENAQRFTVAVFQRRLAEQVTILQEDRRRSSR